jgi:hypothetical protein
MFIWAFAVLFNAKDDLEDVLYIGVALEVVDGQGDIVSAFVG